MRKKTYDIIYSIGTDCACSSYMQRHKLRSCSGPFDWLTHASFKTRMELIINDFKNFLNVEDLIPLEKDPTIANDNKYDYYQNTRNEFYYYHDFPAGINLLESFKDVREKYNRRITRFYDKIKISNRVLIIWLAHNQIVEDFIAKDLCQKITKKFNKNIDFLLIEHDPSKKNGEFERTEILPNVLKYKIETASFDISKNQMLGNIENCDKIFSEYELYRPFYLKFYRTLKKIILRSLAVVIPIKIWRKKLRSFVK